MSCPKAWLGIPVPVIFLGGTYIYGGDRAHVAEESYYVAEYCYCVSSPPLGQITVLPMAHRKLGTEDIMGMRGNGTKGPIGVVLGEWSAGR